MCTGSSGAGLNFAPQSAGAGSFVLADKLAFCRFSYLGAGLAPGDPGIWKPAFDRKGWPFAIRVEMAPLDPNPSRLQPISITVPIYMHRSPDLKYADQ
jgi:hypothetical protein